MARFVKDAGREPGQRASHLQCSRPLSVTAKLWAPAASKFANMELQVETTISNWEKYPQTKYQHFITEFPQNVKKSATTLTVTHTLHVLFILVMRLFISCSRMLLTPRPICEKRNGAHRVDVGTRSACTHVFTSRGHSQLRLQTPAS